MTILKKNARTVIVEQSDQYIHAVVTSLILRFKDDLEFQFSPDEKIIHVRSASRVGYSDFGVNRRRVEGLRSAYATTNSEVFQ